MIRLQGIQKYFNKGRQNEIHVLRGVDLEFPERGMTAIYGKSGCGKTTLLNVIGGLDQFASGTLTVNGQDIRKNTDALRNRCIGYIFQNYNLSKEESCFENVADALRLCGITDEEVLERRVMAALTCVGMEKFRSRRPDTLSGGQQQRIAIARAIVKNPPIILADEPTGNLDEANTVLVMDLLKAISKDCLVLLVTHEANLVDHYCDTVIELSDGAVTAVRKNDTTENYAVKDKNTVYLGDLPKTEITAPEAQISLYGDLPKEPIRLTLACRDGKLYLRVDSAGVQVLDSSSEVQLREGSYEAVKEAEKRSESVDMSALPPIEGTRFGRLFTLGSSVRSGYRFNFKNQKKGKKLLRGCMCLFAAAAVFLTAVFGTAFADILTARSAYNGNVFYVYTPDGTVSSALNAAVNDSESGIDSVHLTYSIPSGDQRVKFMTGFFETFSSSSYDESFETNAVLLPMDLSTDLSLTVGRRDDLTDEEVLITTAVADGLLEKSSLGYIQEYRDLLGMIAPRLSVDGKNLRIVGVVKSDEPAVYLSDYALAVRTLRSDSAAIYLGSAYGVTCSDGEVVYVTTSADDTLAPTVGSSVLLHGKSFTVSQVLHHCTSYESYLSDRGIRRPTAEDYFTELLQREDPSLNGEALQTALTAALEKRIYEYWEMYYEDLDNFLSAFYAFEPSNFEAYLAVEQKIPEAALSFAREDYVKAWQYRQLYGRFPTATELDEVYYDLPELYETLEPYFNRYEAAFYNRYYDGSISSRAYLVNREDYVVLSRVYGETDKAAYGGYFYEEEYYDQKVVYGESGELVSTYTSYPYEDTVYTVIHSTDPTRTEEYLLREFGELEVPYSYMTAVLTPDGIFHSIILQNAEEILVSLISMAVILVILSLCMYFIMRSSLMNRIKEVGIYRAIGVSKKNLTFKFFIESLVLTTLTVFIGYLLTSTFLYLAFYLSPLVSTVFYYPWWLALSVLLLLYVLCILCGILPIRSLLRKTPSQILAKYDI